jgi:VWFA-related protein
MSSPLFFNFLAVLVIAAFMFTIGAVAPHVAAQSKKQTPTETPKGGGKKNTRPTATPTPEEPAEEDPEVLKLETNIVNVDAVVYGKKSKQIITGLKKENFAIFENGVKQDISNFSTPESPITVTVVVEFSKWSELFGSAQSRGFEPPTAEVIRPVAYFLSNFIKPPDDYASVVAFDMRATPITDFTNDPQRLSQVISLLIRNRPAFREVNLFDAMKFSLVGGRGDSVVLEDSKQRTAEYGGMVSVKSKRRAIILVASGWDTFSKTNYDEVRKVIQQAGIPVYIISTGNMFFKLYEHLLPATDSLTGVPGRLSFLQMQNTMNTFARESGGYHIPITFESEVPGALQTFNALLRNQYSLAYDVGDRKDGKKYKLEVKVDVNGDGVYEDKEYVVQHRPFYVSPKPTGSK